jgi:hypothetical protein
MTTAFFPKTADALRVLKPGDRFYSEGILLGVSESRVRWTVMEIKAVPKKALAVVVRATYFGVCLGDYVLSYMNQRMEIHAKAPTVKG